MTDRSRGRERRRKRRRSDDFEDDGISGWKLGLVIGVIVVCFAMLYPTVFHPMIMGFFGAKEQSKPAAAHRPPIHPGMGPGGPRTGGGPRHDHPAMRMAAAQVQDAQQSTGGGRGMFTWMLPIYTVGVVIFLLYTLFKSKKSKKRRRFGSDSEESDSDDCGGQFDSTTGRKKLKGLQERLRQTEEAMTKILEQLEAVQAQGLDIGSIETLQNIPEPQPSSSKSTKVKEHEPGQPVLSAQSEQYIGDLERALKEFKVLSEAYEKEKDRHLVDDSEDESATSMSELNSSASSADSEEEERARQKERARRRKEKERKRKETTREVKKHEEEDDNEDEEELGQKQEEEEDIVNMKVDEESEAEEAVVEESLPVIEEPVASKSTVDTIEVEEEEEPEHVAESKIESKPTDKKVRRRARRI